MMLLVPVNNTLFPQEVEVIVEVEVIEVVEVEVEVELEVSRSRTHGCATCQIAWFSLEEVEM